MHGPSNKQDAIRFPTGQWALILGASSGFGLATARKLAHCGMKLALVHRDRASAMPAIDAAFDELRAGGAELLTFNMDALSDTGRGRILDALQEALGAEGRVRLLLHSLALGNLKPLAPLPKGDRQLRLLDEADFAGTIYAMGSSLASWSQALLQRGLFAADARVLSLTSEGNQIAWPSYAAVSAAKGALEAISRSLALELAPYGIRSNVLQPGVTDTKALRLIPGHEAMKEAALRRNPMGRLTRPEDVADLIALLCTEEAAWLNGALIRVDGGEGIAG